MSDVLNRVTVQVPAERTEEARALALELLPGGFEERAVCDFHEIVMYVGEGQFEAIRAVFPDAQVVRVEPGWEHGWREFHRPVRVGGLWIGPPWEPIPPGESAVVINPGLAFGTGAHATTRLCIQLLAVAPRGSLLDVGCGSGVLAIAAARLGFGPIVAVDNDPVAVEVTLENAAVNKVELEAFVVDGTADLLPQVDVAVANILLGTVESVVPGLRASTVITSGYLTGERPALAGWAWVAGVEADGWAADTFRPRRL